MDGEAACQTPAAMDARDTAMLSFNVGPGGRARIFRTRFPDGQRMVFISVSFVAWNSLIDACVASVGGRRNQLAAVARLDQPSNPSSQSFPANSFGALVESSTAWDSPTSVQTVRRSVITLTMLPGPAISTSCARVSICDPCLLGKGILQSH